MPRMQSRNEMLRKGVEVKIISSLELHGKCEFYGKYN